MSVVSLRSSLRECVPIDVRPGSRWTIEFSAVALRNLQSVNLFRGDDVLLHVINRPDQGLLVVNDCINGIWGAEWAVAAPLDAGKSRLTVELCFQETGLVVGVAGGESMAIEGRFVVHGEVEAAMPRTIALSESLRAEPEPVQSPPGGADEAAEGAEYGQPAAVVETPASIGVTVSGVLDECAFCPSIGGWLVTGWMPAELPVDATGVVLAEVEPVEAAARREVLAIQYERPDIRDIGHAFVLLITCEVTDTPFAPPRQITLTISPGVLARLTQSPGFCLRDEASMHRMVRDVLTTATRGGVNRLRSLLDRAHFTGQDSFAQLGVPAHVEVDEVIRVRPGAAVIIGWCLDPLGLVESIHLCRGAATSEPLQESWMRTPRPDIVDAFSSRYGLVERHAGFLAWADTQATREGTLFLEIRLTDGRTGLKPLPLPTRRGAAALRRILGAASLPGHDLDRIFDRILGPPLTELNRQRLAQPLTVREERFGTLPEHPRVSLIVPLYGRLDFMRCQLAFFSGHRMADDEVIYVLDQPERASELLAMARSAHGSIGMPFRVLLMSENRGFGPASNVGLAAARGQYVLFLNSDVFPESADWLDRLVETLEGDETLGVVGPLLLFADGSVQHAGMTLEPLRDQSNWLFPRHPMKGRAPARTVPRVQEAAAVTGAAMLMQREVARELGGFDPDYAIGDFEDVDLCLRTAALGLRCAVDMSVRARHLERQSQNAGSADWRQNTTLLNAWTFNRRLRRARPASEGTT